MKPHKKTVMVILLVILMLILVQAAVNVVVNTEVVAIDAVDAEISIVLIKYGEVNSLIECKEWNFTTRSCPNWQKSSLTFEQNETHIWFDTTQSGAYAGIQEPLKKYKDEKELKINFKDKENKKTGDITIDLENGQIIVRATKDKTKIKMNGVKSTIDFEIIIGEAEGRSVIAVENDGELEIDNATITLPKIGNVRAISYCTDENFNFVELTCSDWETTNIPFVDNGDTITFVVSHFTAYSGTSAVIIDGVV